MDEALKAAVERVPTLREALEEIWGCWSAAETEGLSDRVNELPNSAPGTLADLFIRRLNYIPEIARAALNPKEGR